MKHHQSKMMVLPLAYVLSTLYSTSKLLHLSNLVFVAQQIGVSPSDYGRLQLLHGILQVFGGPIFATLVVHRFGVRLALGVCYLVVVLASLVQIMATDYEMLWWSQAIGGCFAHGHQVVQTLLASHTAAGRQRTNAFSRLGFSIGLSLMIAPFVAFVAVPIAGTVGPPAAAILLASVGLVLLVAMVPPAETKTETMAAEEVVVVGVEHAIKSNVEVEEEEEEDADSDSDEQRKKTTAAQHASAVERWHMVVSVLSSGRVQGALLRKHLSIMPAFLVFSTVQIWVIEQLGVSQQHASLLQMTSGVTLLLSNGLGVPYLRRRFAERTLLTFGCGAFLFSYAQFATLSSVWQLAAAMPANALGMSLVSSAADSLLTSRLDAKRQAVALGVSSALGVAGRTAAPALAAALVEAAGFAALGAVGLAGAGLSLVSIVMTSPKRKRA